MTTTPFTTQRINVAYPETPSPRLVLRLGPCRLSVHPYDGTAWIDGSYDDPTRALPIDVATGPQTTISQHFDPVGFNATAMPRLEIAISRARPFELEINAGANDLAFDLGGLPLSRVTVKAGAGRFDIDFGAPNPGEMSLLELSAGAGAFTGRHLANARFAAMRSSGGVSASTLDFGGALTRDATVRIDAGLGSVDLVVPATTAAFVRSKSFAAGIRMVGAFSKDGDVYVTPAARQGAHPRLEIDASVAFGALNLTTS